MTYGIRSVTVALRPGIGHAVLPDNRSMVQGKNYAIPYADYQRLGKGALQSVITEVSFDTAVKSIEGIDLTTNGSSLPTVTGGSGSHKLGRTTLGFAGELFRLVKLHASSAAVAAGDAVVWAGSSTAATTSPNVDEATNVVTTLQSTTFGTAGHASLPPTLAGIAVATGTAGNYIWVQVDGPADAVNAVTVAAGDPVALSGTDKKLGKASVNAVQTLTLTAGATGDKFSLTFNGHASALVTIPASGFASTTAALIQAAINSISDFSLAADQPVVTGPTGGPFVITFSAGQYAGKPVGAITVTGTTGAAAGSVAQTTTGVAATSPAVGIATTAGTTPDVVLRWPYQRPRHDRRDKNLFVRT